MNHWFFFLILFLCSRDELNGIKECHNLEVRGLCVCLWKMVCVNQDESNKHWKPYILPREMTMCKMRGVICRPCYRPALVFGGTMEVRRGRAVIGGDQVLKALVQMLTVSMAINQGRDATAFCKARGTFLTAVTLWNSCVVWDFEGLQVYLCICFIYLLKHPGEMVKPSLWGGWESDYGKFTLQWLSSH